MKLRTTLAAGPAVALLALATCADPPTPTAAHPAGLGAEASALPPGPGGASSPLASQGECRIISTFGDSTNTHLIGPKDVRPDPDSASTVAVAEGGSENDYSPVVFWFEGVGCPTGKLNLEIDSARGLGKTKDPDSLDFRLWDLTDYWFHYRGERQRWFMTYSPVIEDFAGYEVGLELVQYQPDARVVFASRTDTAIWALATQKCWLHLIPFDFRYNLRVYPGKPWHSEACRVPFLED